MGHPLIFHMEGILSSGAMEPLKYGHVLGDERGELALDLRECCVGVWSGRTKRCRSGGGDSVYKGSKVKGKG